MNEHDDDLQWLEDQELSPEVTQPTDEWAFVKVRDGEGSAPLDGDHMMFGGRTPEEAASNARRFFEAKQAKDEAEAQPDAEAAEENDQQS